MCQNLAFRSRSTWPDVHRAAERHLPAAGVATEDGVRSPAEVAEGIGAALGRLLGDDARAVELLGGIVNDGVPLAPGRRGLG